MSRDYSEKNNLNNSDVGWSASNLFYIYLNELDMDYRDTYYLNDWGKMYKVFKLKYMKVVSYIHKYATKEELQILRDDTIINNQLEQLKQGSSDYITKWNNNLVNSIIKIIETKMLTLDSLMAQAGMNVILEKHKERKPAALSTDDF